VRIPTLFSGFAVAICLASTPWADEVKTTAPAAAEAAVTNDSGHVSFVAYAPETSKILLDVRSRAHHDLQIGPNDPNIAFLTAAILEQSHYTKKTMDDTISSLFLDHYIDMLDYLHLNFFQSDLAEFEKFRKQLDDMTEKRGDVTPAHLIFARLLQRVEQRVEFVGNLLTTEEFEFTGNERYNLDRRKAAFPKDMDDARKLWRTHLRYEILQEKLNKEKPEEMATKIARRYARLLRTLQDYDGDDILELYLSALAQVYDPHSDYMGKSAFESFNIGMKLSLFGIGALLRSEDGYCKIQSLVPNGPAEKSEKLNPNDRIIAVAQGDGEPVDVVDMKLNKVVDLIRGPKDSEVRLTVIPADAADPSVRKVVKIIRDKIKLEEQQAKAKLIEMPAQEGKTHALRLGVIDLPSFYAEFDLEGAATEPENRKSTTRDVEKLIAKLKKEHVDGLVLDLRRNGGGSLEEAINLTGLFIRKGPVVQVKDYAGNVFVDEDTDEKVVYDGPLIVLTSRFSASASEILAGALQDYGRALIVGDSSTHGKGTVQSLVPLKRHLRPKGSESKDPGTVKLTIRKFYRASGESTQLNGVTPDIVLSSVNNHADVGEASLERAMEWDTIKSASYEKLNRITPILEALRTRSEQRTRKDQDFAYRLEDIEQYKKNLADRSVSLNEAERHLEKDRLDAKLKARREEIAARPATRETVYDLTLALADKEGLPDPIDNEKVAEEAAKAAAADEESDGEPKVAPIDVTLKEVKRILVDLIELRTGKSSVAAALN
jgi:carboxyl-terminal processing protease